MRPKHIIHPVLLILLVVLSSCRSLAYAPHGRSRAIDQDFFGLAHAGEAPRDYRLMEKVGATWARTTFRWDSINPAPDEWDFSRFDNLIDLADQNGARVIATLGYDVGWIHREGEPRRRINPEQLPYFLEYVRRTVERYRGRVDAWEIWNEPNVIFWKGSDEDFVRLSLESARLIRELDPETPILAGDTFRVGARLIRKLADAGVFEYADALSFHPYSFFSADAVPRLIYKAEQLAKHEAGGAELWITEIGYPTGGWYPNRVTRRANPEFTLKTLVAATAYPVERLVWYKTFDKYMPGACEQDCLNSEYYFGLALPNESLKSGGETFAFFSRLVRASQYDPSGLILSRKLKRELETALYRRTDGSALLVAWRRFGNFDEPLRIAADPESRIIEHDLDGSPASGPLQAWEGPIGSRPLLLRFEAPLDQIKISSR